MFERNVEVLDLVESASRSGAARRSIRCFQGVQRVHKQSSNGSLKSTKINSDKGMTRGYSMEITRAHYETSRMDFPSLGTKVTTTYDIG